VSGNDNGEPSPLRFENVEAKLLGFGILARAASPADAKSTRP
jgi:hypothetical protein